jgi:hypothetical protein
VYLNFNFPNWIFKVRIILSFAKLSIQVAGEINKGCLLFQKKDKLNEIFIIYLIHAMHGYN